MGIVQEQRKAIIFQMWQKESKHLTRLPQPRGEKLGTMGNYLTLRQFPYRILLDTIFETSVHEYQLLPCQQQDVITTKIPLSPEYTFSPRHLLHPTRVIKIRLESHYTQFIS